MTEINLTVKELIAMCKKQNIKGFSHKTKAEILQLMDERKEGKVKTKAITSASTNEEASEGKQLEVLEGKKEPKKVAAEAKPNKKQVLKEDKYSREILVELFSIHLTYVQKRIETGKKLGVAFRLPGLPEDISENLIKFMIHHSGDQTSKWVGSGDLVSSKEGKQECKSFTSDGPISFTPTGDWNVIYFLDARNWLNNDFKLYRSDLKKSSDEWKQIKVSQAQTFGDQSREGRRPRINWKVLHPQIAKNCIKIFDGGIEDIFK